jgi:predicted nuclease with RNAse H fold
VAIDAPLSKPGQGSFRKADLLLREYGTLPLNMRGMVALTERGIKLKEKIRNFRLIEVFPRATAILLGYYDADEKVMQKKMLEFGLTGDPERRLLTKDEIDAVSAAITGYLHLQGKTREVGDEEGKIVVPEV